LAGGISHDFNNLLSVILSYSELLGRNDRTDDAMRRELTEIKNAGNRAAALTRQLLAFSRQQVLEPRVLDLNTILDGIERMLRRVIGEDLELRIVKEPELSHVKVDPSQIEQVILNLVVNARDAMPGGGVLTIETANVLLDASHAAAHADAQPGPYAMLSVSDTGLGMDVATQRRIFEPFFTTKDKGKGTGLGLSTVYGIVRQSGGAIWVHSEPEKGSTFRVYFPKSDEAPSETHAEVDAPVMRRGTETILLVEDEEQVRVLVHDILRHHGYRVFVARTPGEAIGIAGQHDGAIELLLTDVVMPQMSGHQLARILKPARAKMRVLYMSGYTDSTILRFGELDSGFAFLQKPITPDGLLRKVRETLDAEHRDEVTRPA
jgi:two-component system, cell cycle sensor histidine kinase and response regulator CckA